MTISSNVVSVIYDELRDLELRMLVIDQDVMKHIPFCRRNLLCVSNYCYKHLFHNTVHAIVNNKKEFRLWDKDEYWKRFFDYSKTYEFTNQKFLYFFLSFFTPLYLCMKQKIENIVLNDDDLTIHERIRKTKNHIKKLYNLIAVQLYGLDITCEILKDVNECKETHCEPLCEKYGSKRCGNQVSNTIILFVNPMYYETSDLFDRIMESLKLIKNPDSVILFVDYTYVFRKGEIGIYNWEETGAISRYELVKDYVKQIYFVNFQDKVDFGSYEEIVKPYLIYNEDDYNKVMDAWRKHKEAIKLR